MAANPAPVGAADIQTLLVHGRHWTRTSFVDGDGMTQTRTCWNRLCSDFCCSTCFKKAAAETHPDMCQDKACPCSAAQWRALVAMAVGIPPHLRTKAVGE